MQAGVGAGVAAFLAGLLSFFSPCVAPLVPGYIGYLSGAALRGASAELKVNTDGGRQVDAPTAVGMRSNPAVAACLRFVAGFSAAFVALGLASASFGRLLVAYQPVLETLAGIVMVVMGAFLLDLLPR